MSSASHELAARKTNPLFLPMVIVSSLAVAEAIGLVIVLVMLARQGPSPAPPGVGTAGMASGGGASAAGRGSGPAGAAAVPAAGTARPPTEMPHGKRGERVESAGFAITLEKIVDRPPSDPLGQVGPERRYLALLLLVENNTGSNVSFYPVQFRLQDSQSYEYKPLAMKLIAPALDWRNLGNRETVRGYVDFIVPRSAKGLSLIYTHLAQPIHVDLDE